MRTNYLYSKLFSSSIFSKKIYFRFRKNRSEQTPGKLFYCPPNSFPCTPFSKVSRAVMILFAEKTTKFSSKKGEIQQKFYKVTYIFSFSQKCWISHQLILWVFKVILGCFLLIQKSVEMFILRYRKMTRQKIANELVEETAQENKGLVFQNVA